jgi:NitT/TauT family transport system substrate-binding protein
LLELEDQTRWAVRNGLTGRTDMPNYLNHLDMDALQAVAPAAVTVIH